MRRTKPERLGQKHLNSKVCEGTTPIYMNLKAAITSAGAVGFFLVVEESQLSLLFSFSETAASITISQIDYIRNTWSQLS